MWRGLTFLFLAGLGFGLFSLIITISGPAAVWTEIRALGPIGFSAMLANDFLATCLWLLSWWMLLWALGATPTWREVTGAGIAGYAVSYLTPVMYLGGEPVRALLIARRTGCKLSTISATIILDRLLAGLSLVVLAITGGSFVLTSLPLSGADRWALISGVAALSAAVGLGILSFARHYHWLSRILESVGRWTHWRWLSNLATSTAATEDDVFIAFTQHLPKTAIAFLLQLLSMLCTYLRPFIFFYFSQGTRFSFAELTVYFNLNALLTVLFWFTPAGIGTTEGGRVGIFQLLGVAPAAACGFSLTVRFLELILVGIGLVYLAEQGLLQVVKGRMASGRSWLGFCRGILETIGFYFYGLFGRLLPHLFAHRYRQPDPWNYETSAYEQRKYDLTLASVPRQPQPERIGDPPYQRILEVGCAEGVFTEKLAQRGFGGEILGLDFVSLALDRARTRCASFPKVGFVLMDIANEMPSGPFDLIFCSEVLYYLGPRKLREVARRIINLLSPGGNLVLVNPWPAAKLICRPFLRHPDLVLVHENVVRDSFRPYAITVLERRSEH